MKLRLEQLNDVDSKPAVEAGFSHATFEVTAIKLTDLRHTDSNFGFTKVSRPFVTFTWSDAPKYTTNRDSSLIKEESSSTTLHSSGAVAPLLRSRIMI